MTSRDFCYWLQGFLEIANPQSMTQEQTIMVRKHLNMVFIHEIDPSFPEEQQNALNVAHGNKPEPLSSCVAGESSVGPDTTSNVPSFPGLPPGATPAAPGFHRPTNLPPGVVAKC